MTAGEGNAVTQSPPRWSPIGPVERRVLGVLIEKAKTTPDVYPMTVAAICAGCNQKNCRHPLMQLEPEDVEEALERLRQLGAVGYVESSGRALRFRHYAYEWFGVNKAELAVLAELLLRGPQTEGQLRAHVSRMEPINDLGQLRAIIRSLKEKGLVVSLTPEARGHVVTHTLYLPKEMEKIREEYAREAVPVAVPDQAEVGSEDTRGAERMPSVFRAAAEGSGRNPDETRQLCQKMLEEIQAMRWEMAEIRQELNRLAKTLAHNGTELGELRRRFEQLL